MASRYRPPRSPPCFAAGSTSSIPIGLFACRSEHEIPGARRASKVAGYKGFAGRALLVSAFVFLLFAFVSIAADAAEPRRVLLLRGFGHAYSPWSDVAGSFRTDLVRKSTTPIDIIDVSLETARIQQPQNEKPFVDYIRALFSGGKPDLIVPVGAPAAFFMQRHRAELFPATPMLIIGAASRRIPAATLTNNDTAVLFDVDLPALIENILNLLPGTKNVAVVIGNSPVERYWTSQVRRDFQRFAGRVNFTWFNNLTFAEMLKRAASMPPHSAIFWGLLSEDASGVSYLQDRALERMRQVANAPIFGSRDYQLGRGIVGGPLQQTRRVGQEGAATALRILAGEKPGSIKPQIIPTGTPTYDWRELQRWNIREASLPAGSMVEYREPTVWEQYWWYIAAAVAILLAQTLLVVYVLLQNRQRRRVELALRESEERMAFTAASVNVGLWQFESATNELWATEHCRKMLGLEDNVPLTRDTFLTAIHPEDREAAIAALRESRYPGQAVRQDLRFVLPDGQVRWISVRARVRADDRGAPNQLSGIFVDITDRKTAESEAALQHEEIAHLTRVAVLGELSGAIAHEINQPLTAIQSNAETGLDLLAESSPDLAEVREVIHDIIHDNRRATEIIKRLRNLLKKNEKKSEPVGVNDLIKAMLALLNSELIGHRIKVKLDLADALPPTSGDPVQLQQVILNLLMNAIDAMEATPPKQRLLTISTRATQAGTVDIFVKDRGPGLCAVDGSQPFEPFYTTKAHGLGLGLTICSTIVEAHNGTLTLANSPDGGAVAGLSLPAEEMRIAAE